MRGHVRIFRVQRFFFYLNGSVRCDTGSQDWHWKYSDWV